MTLAAEAYLSHLRSDAAAMAEAGRRSRLDAAVPACPGWDLHELLAHTSGVHRWAAEMVRTGAREPISRRGMPSAPEGAGVVEWLEEGAADLVRVLTEAGPDKEVWNWTSSRRSYFWFRRQAQETAVHRWDAQSVGGTGAPVPLELAIDGLDELVSMWVPDPDFAPRGPWLAGSLHIHATDGQGEWTLLPGADTVTVRTAHGKADAAVRGTASDLLLFLWNRDAPVEVFGEPAVLASWKENLRI